MRRGWRSRRKIRDKRSRWFRMGTRSRRGNWRRSRSRRSRKSNWGERG